MSAASLVGRVSVRDPRGEIINVGAVFRAGKTPVFDPTEPELIPAFSFDQSVPDEIDH